MPRVHLNGSTQFTRTQGARSCVLQHATELTIGDTHAVWRVTDDGTGDTVSVPIRDRAAVHALREVDAAMLRTARRHELVDPIYKTGRRTRQKAPGPPQGWVWCPECLGDAELSPTCLTCDGERIVRASDHP